MLQNFKTDIIYFNTATDFELEFNLCGCCRMRLFNDKCNDKKSLLLSLSKAVSRSRIIIITAALFNDDNVVKIIAEAIGTKTEKVNNADYNINSTAEINIIKGALPLVTEDGIFGGCIIESGPQSLILLTDNKPVRKTIMKNLIHQYIKEIAMDEDDTDLELITEDSEEIQDGEEIINADNMTNDELIIEDAELEEDEEDSENNQAPVNQDIYSNSELITDTTPTESDADETYYYEDEDEYYTDEPKEKSSKFSIWTLVLSIIILLALAVLSYCIFYVPTTEGVSPSAYIKEIFDTLFK